MNERTKKLDLALSEINFKVGVNLQHLSPITRRKILRACKKSGMKFVGDFDGCDWFYEHDMTEGSSLWDCCPSLKSTEDIEL